MKQPFVQNIYWKNSIIESTESCFIDQDGNLARYEDTGTVMLPTEQMVTTVGLEPKGITDLIFQLLIVPEGLAGIGTDRILYAIDYAGYMNHRLPLLLQSPTSPLHRLRKNARFYRVPQGTDNLYDLTHHPEANTLINASRDGASIYWYNYGSVLRSLVNIPMTRTYPAILNVH